MGEVSYIRDIAAEMAVADAARRFVAASKRDNYDQTRAAEAYWDLVHEVNQAEIQ